MTKYNIDAINGCMQTALDHKPKFGEISDTFPELCTASSVYGDLPSSAGLASAVDALNDLVHDELSAAEDRLDGVAVALDAVVQTVRNTEDEGERTYGAQPRYVQV